MQELCGFLMKGDLIDALLTPLSKLRETGWTQMFQESNIITGIFML